MNAQAIKRRENVGKTSGKRLGNRAETARKPQGNCEETARKPRGKKMADEFETALTEIKELHIRNSFDTIQSAWLCLIFRELRRIRENLENPLSTPNHGVDKCKAKESARERIEATYDHPLRELLAERKGKTVREIASEFGVSKTLVSRWRSRGVKDP